jgi:hypothetical protein
MDFLFQKGSAQLSYQKLSLITPRVQKTTPPRNFLSLKFRSQGSKLKNV